MYCSISFSTLAVTIIFAEKNSVAFTYSVEWAKSDVAWASRWDTYLRMSDVEVSTHHKQEQDTGGGGEEGKGEWEGSGRGERRESGKGGEGERGGESGRGREEGREWEWEWEGRGRGRGEGGEWEERGRESERGEGKGRGEGRVVEERKMGGEGCENRKEGEGREGGEGRSGRCTCSHFQIYIIMVTQLSPDCPICSFPHPHTSPHTQASH